MELNLKYFILKQIILIAQKWQDQADRVVEEQLGLTVKQWMLLSIIEDEFQDHLPALGETAESIGTSRQNTKRLALELQKKGYLIIATDPVDHRILRFALTGKHREFFRTNKHNMLFNEITNRYFEDMDPKELKLLNNSIAKIYRKIS